MSWTLTIRPRAKADLSDAYSWYEERCAGLGDEFLAAISEALLRIESNPERFPVYYRGFRRALTHQFPYKIFYVFEGHHIIVVRILHGAQHHPGKLEL